MKNIIQLFLPNKGSRFAGRSKIPVIEHENLSVLVTKDRKLVRAAQRLRYKVFGEEMHGTLTAKANRKKRDFDEYDSVCDHLVVIDNNIEDKKERVVGNYRMLRSSLMKPKLGYYTETEYNVDAIKQKEGELLELGRSCVHPDYRNKVVMQLLWQGLAHYILKYDIKLMFGCASFHGVDVEEFKQNLAYLHHFHLAPEELRAKARDELYVDMNLIAKDEIDERRSFASLPTIIKGYLRVGAFVGDGAVIDNSCNTLDVSIVVPTENISQKYLDKFSKGADSTEGKE